MNEVPSSQEVSKVPYSLYYGLSFFLYGRVL